MGGETAIGHAGAGGGQGAIAHRPRGAGQDRSREMAGVAGRAGAFSPRRRQPRFRRRPRRTSRRQTRPAAQAAKPAPAAQPPPSLQRRPSPSLSPFPTEMDVSLSLAIAEVALPQGHGARPRGGARNPQGRDHRAAAQGRAAGRHGAAGQRQPRRPRPRTARPSLQPAGHARGRRQVQATGDFSLAGPKLRDTLAWLGIDTSGVPADKLQKLDLKGKLASTANGLQIARSRGRSRRPAGHGQRRRHLRACR